MTQHVKNLRTMPTKFSPEIIAHILKLVKPQPDEAYRCELNIIGAAELIAAMPPYVSPTVERHLLQDVVAKLEAARAAIKALPRSTGLVAFNAAPYTSFALPAYVEFHADAATIAEMAKRVAKMATKITAQRSTGSPKKHTVARQKRIAAEHAAYLLKGRRLTTASDGILNRTAVALFELGTGRVAAERSLEKACAKVLRVG